MDHAQKLTKLFELKKPTIRIFDLMAITWLVLTVLQATKEIALYELTVVELLTYAAVNVLLLILLSLSSQLIFKRIFGKYVKVNLLDELGKIRDYNFNPFFIIGLILYTIIDIFAAFTVENKMEILFLFAENIVLSFYMAAINVYLIRKALNNK